MYNHQIISKPELLFNMLKEFIKDSETTISLLANSIALLKQYYPSANWIGYYFVKEQTLHLGPFIGESACIKIPFDKGFCGLAARSMETQIVADVHTEDFHIACDANSQSEIVVPIIINNELYGVLDIDSPLKNNFDISDKDVLEEYILLLKTGIKKELI